MHEKNETDIKWQQYSEQKGEKNEKMKWLKGNNLEANRCASLLRKLWNVLNTE